MAEKLLDNVYTLVDDQTLSATTKTSAIDLSSCSDTVGFSVFWENGSSLNANISVEVSNIDSDAWYVELGETITNITSASSSYAASVISGHKFMRLKIAFAAGSADFSINAYSKPTTVRGA